jgi:glycosyltransferase involved in cell wall biosynthesis
MRILMFSNWFPPVISGSSYYTSSLAKTLAARGHDLAVVTVDWGNDDVREEHPFPLYRLPTIKLPRLPVFYNLQLVGITNTARNFKQLVGIVRDFQPDIIHHVNHIFDSVFLTARVAKRTAVPLVGSITTLVQHEDPLIQWVMSLADRFTLGPFGVRHWDGIVSLDKSADRYVREIYGRNVHARSRIIPFGVRLESEALYSGSLPKSPHPTILFTGHIHPFRNPNLLIQAMPQILQKVPDARLALAGRVDLKAPVETARRLGLTDDQVQFLGETPHEEVVRLMKTSHVFASWVTGPYTGLGTAPMEAMLCSLPVVNDLPEDLFGSTLLENGRNIALIDSKDSHAIAEGIINLLLDPALREKVGAGGRRFVLEYLNWPSIAARMEQMYLDTIHGKITS